MPCHFIYTPTHFIYTPTHFICTPRSAHADLSCAAQLWRRTFLLLMVLAFPASAVAIMTFFGTVALATAVAGGLSAAVSYAVTAVRRRRVCNTHRRGCNKRCAPTPANRCPSFGGGAAPELVALSPCEFAGLYARCEAKRPRYQSTKCNTPAKPVKVVSRADAYVVALDVPGIRMEDLVVTAHAGSYRAGVTPRVTVAGSTNQALVDRTVPLPTDAAIENASVSLENGVLQLEVPRIKRLIPISKPSPMPTDVSSPASANVAKETVTSNEPSSPLLRECEPDELNVRVPDEAYASEGDEPEEAEETKEAEEWEQVTLKQ